MLKRGSVDISILVMGDVSDVTGGDKKKIKEDQSCAVSLMNHST